LVLALLVLWRRTTFITQTTHPKRGGDGVSICGNTFQSHSWDGPELEFEDGMELIVGTSTCRVCGMKAIETWKRKADPKMEVTA